MDITLANWPGERNLEDGVEKDIQEIGEGKGVVPAEGEGKPILRGSEEPFVQKQGTGILADLVEPGVGKSSIRSRGKGNSCSAQLES